MTSTAPNGPYDFFSHAEANPKQTAVTMADTETSYSRGELAARARALAQWLVAQGLEPGGKFAVVLENRIEVLELVLAARLAGAYAVVLSTHLSPAEVAYIVSDSRPEFIIASDRTAPQLAGVAAAKHCPFWTVDGANSDVMRSLPDAVRAMAAGASVDLDDRPLGSDLLYSSGTTGRPKGVLQPMLPSHYRHEAAPPTLVTRRYLLLSGDTVYLSPAPLYHAAPLRYSLRVLDSGGQAVIMARFDAEPALALIERYHVTHSQWVPAMFRRLLALPDAVRKCYDLSSLRVAIHAAAPCPVPLKQAMLDWWGDVLYEYYAGSEGCGTTLITSAEWRERPGSVGRAISGQVHILDDQGHELPTGEIGNIYFSGGGKFSYLNDPEKTARAVNDRGWATYGDVGHVDRDGYLYLSDRRADLIVSGGVNLYPQEIENALMLHPAVREVAVIGVPSEDFGEQPLAAVVLRDGEAPTLATAQAIIARATQDIGRIKLPQRVVFVDELPRLATGKLLRRTLKERYRPDAEAGFFIPRTAHVATPSINQETP